MNRYEKPDAWSRKARAEGYPARSVYKLQEILRKFPLLPVPPPEGGSQAALDLGAAPGSWSLYLLRNLAGAYRRPRAHVVACDLSPPDAGLAARALSAGRRFTFVRGDMNAPETAAALEAHGPYALVLCDAAPATSGSRLVDGGRSLGLAETALGYAARTLERGGGFAVKLFQGDGSDGFREAARALFTAVRTFKPSACRPNSTELYVIGIGRR